MTKRIAILTGGGDCPGLNAAIRAVTKSANNLGIEVYGIEEGFLGLYLNHIHPMDLKSVSGILPLGGTILRSSRFNPFKDKDVLKQCLHHYKENKFDGLIVIGGDGSLGIALDLHSQENIPVIGIPKTIDNDINGTDHSIGFYTAVQTACDAIDKLHTTAESHNFVMVLEVMGRHCGYIAAYAGLAGGADYIMVPEEGVQLYEVVQSIKDRHARGKNFSIVVVAEDAKLYDEKKILAESGTIKDEYGKIKLGGIGQEITHILKNQLGFEARYTNLGYIQRGGAPTVIDRILATKMGCKAIDLVTQGDWGKLVAENDGKIVAKDLKVVRESEKQMDLAFYDMAKRFFQ
jgi:ATP-dependent phosphofructokinase / diphosphate-dependent phosphofructokinase